MFQHPKMRHVYVGTDIHRKTHTATIINCFFERLGEITFENKPSGFEKLLKEVKKYTAEGITPLFGLEDVIASGRELAMFLIEKGYPVKYVNASLTHSERKNQSTLHKTDSFDSLCVARVLLSKMDELPDAKPDDTYWALTELVTKRRALVKACVVLKNQLHNYLIHHYPSYKSFFAVFESQTSLAFYENYPSPSKLKDVSACELGEFLKKYSHNFYNEKKAKEILSLIAKDGDTTREYQDVRDFIVTTSINQLKENLKTINGLEEQLKSLLKKFDYKLETMKGINYVTAAAIIGEVGDINRFANAGKLAKYAGISPVQYSSGQTEKNFSNKRGNRNLHQIFFFLAVSLCTEHGTKGKPYNPILAEYYKKKISQGKTKKQGLKCVMRRLVNIIYRMMKDKTEYREP